MNIFIKKVVTFVSEFQQHLLQHYERRHSCLALPPLFPDADANLESFYVPPRIDVIRKRGGRRVVQCDGQVQCFKDIFFHDNEALKDVFIQGESGIGKSSFCAKIIHSWCKAHNSDDTTMRKENVQFFHDYDVLRIFDYLFFVSLRDSSEYECDIDRMILHQVVNYLPNSQMYCDTFLQGILAGKRCLILLDGLDEWAHPDRSLHKCGCKPKTPYPFRRTRNNCTVVSTTRQWYLAKHPVRDSEMGLLLQISGITDTSVLINKVLGCLDEKFGERPLVEDFDKVVSRNQLENLMAIPLMCMQLLCLWFEGRLDCKSHAQIYSSMVDMLFGRVHEKKGVSDYDSVPVPLYEPRLDADEELPDFFADDLNIIANKSLFFSLCRLAYHTLVDWLGCSSGIFEGRAVLDNLTGIEWSAALEVGILTQKQSQNVLTTRRTTYSFLHRTIQEFLSAVHIVCVGRSREEREQMIVDIGDESLSETKEHIRVFVHDLAD